MRPWWLWTVASVAQDRCLPFLHQWDPSEETAFEVLGGKFRENFQVWSHYEVVTCGTRAAATNLRLQHLPEAFPEGMSHAQFEEELGRSLFGVPSSAWKQDAIEVVAKCWECPDFPEVVSLFLEEDRRMIRAFKAQTSHAVGAGLEAQVASGHAPTTGHPAGAGPRHRLHQARRRPPATQRVQVSRHISQTPTTGHPAGAGLEAQVASGQAPTTGPCSGCRSRGTGCIRPGADHRPM